MSSFNFSSSRREERINAYYDDSEIIEQRQYNLVLAGTLLEGLVVNYILCLTMQDYVLSLSPTAFFIGYIVSCFAGIMLSSKSNNPFISFIGYNLVVVPVGLVISISVYAFGGVNSPIVRQTFLVTAIIVAVMVVLSMIFEDFFSSLGKVLGCSLLIILIVDGVSLLFGIGFTLITLFGSAIFSLYIGYDFWRSQQYTPTVDNAIDSAVDIYLDIANLFLKILRLMSRSSGGRRR